ncbi:MAG: 2-oxoglutarate dehydrogenase, E2 component, dihydrolipoamide succinyltransferase, partial [Polyangiaceae bacterium]
MTMPEAPALAGAPAAPGAPLVPLGAPALFPLPATAGALPAPAVPVLAPAWGAPAELDGAPLAPSS